MARVFGSISVISFLLAALLLLNGASPGGGAVLARAFRVPVAAPAATPLVCPGVQVTGAHAGCFVFTQIICRPQTGGGAGEDVVLAEGILPGTSRAAIQVTPNQTRFALTIFGASISLFGGPARSYDIQRGADLDLDVGQVGTPSASHLKGWISCGV